MDLQSIEDRADSRMRTMLRHTWLVAIAGSLALAGLVALAFYFGTRPTILRIAVGPPNSEDVRVIQSIAQQLARERAPVRLRLLVKDGVVESAAALDRDEVDLAVVRRDRAMPQAGQAVAILRRNLVVLVAPPPPPPPPAAGKAKRAKKSSAKEEEVKKIEKIEELAGRRIAVIGR